MSAFQVFSNNAKSKLVALTGVGGIYKMELLPGDMQKFATLDNNTFQILTIREGDKIEIVKMFQNGNSPGESGLSPDEARILRAQEGTSKINDFTTDADVYAAVTAEWLQSINDFCFPPGY